MRVGPEEVPITLDLLLARVKWHADKLYAFAEGAKSQFVLNIAKDINDVINEYEQSQQAPPELPEEEELTYLNAPENCPHNWCNGYCDLCGAVAKVKA